MPPFSNPNPLMSAQLLALPHAGAVGVIGYSRWGWVSKSHLLQRAFLDSLFAHPEWTVPEAMYAAQAEYYYYRDLVLGQNYHGDPTLKLYTSVPDSLMVTVEYNSPHTFVTVMSNDKPVKACAVFLSKDNHPVEQTETDARGNATFLTDLSLGDEYTVAAVHQGYTTYIKTFTPSVTTDINTDETDLPTKFTLYQNYPNPFNPSTVIEFVLPYSSMVDMSIFNVLGQRVTSLINRKLSVGKHRVIWEATDKQNNPVPSGIYFYRLETESFSEIKKMVLLR
jgi:hypothetical protein